MNKHARKISGGKKLRNVKDKLQANKLYQLGEAVQFLKSNAYAKFDETLELVLKLNIDGSRSDHVVRGVTQLPHGTGKVIRIAAFAEGKNADIAKEAGADVVGLEDLIDSIKKEKLDFDICVATPDVMPKISQVAKILGPRGMMPNPKLGTVGPNIADMIKQIKAGQVEFCADKTGIVHSGAGKLSFSVEFLSDNIKALIAAVERARPAGIKTTYISSAFLSSTMGPALKIDFNSL